ncbi:hypothetical protein EYF80_057898 [Liparis tanakae]|uniref:Uncharacterized protein n=1 Tax=Liparis tanakae TaxID=230148 RepID=A0A4Z2EUJ2_9TELE|nr:hypothetical protein EYF80_057898 [Liparis tanakae]
MSINTLTALLRSDTHLKRDLRQQLQEVGVTPGTVTKVTSLCSKLSEGEAKDLCSSVGALAARSIEFKEVAMLPASDLTVATGRATEFKSFAIFHILYLGSDGQQLQHLANQSLSLSFVKDRFEAAKGELVGMFHCRIKVK